MTTSELMQDPARGDCLIWVGHSYPTIDDFIAEARELGCCRKVPFWPSWLRRGSRVFLAHHDGQTKPERGVIFGYFVLGGVDVIVEPDDPPCAPSVDPNTFVSHSHGIPPQKPDPGFARAFTTHHTALVRARLCGEDGLRYPREDGRPTLYLVDRLARKINDEFSGALQQILADMRKRDDGKTHDECIAELRAEAGKELFAPKRQKGLAAFADVVRHVHARRIAARDQLVLFPKPYPVLEHEPFAWFRGMARVNGDRIIDLASSHRRIKLPLPYAATRETGARRRPIGRLGLRT